MRASYRGAHLKYKTMYNEMLIAHARRGGDLKSFAGTIGATMELMFVWVDRFPSFDIARKLAEVASYKFWLEFGRDGIVSGDLRASAAWIFAMKNLHGWKDKVDPNDQPHVKQEPITIVVDKKGAPKQLPQKIYINRRGATRERMAELRAVYRRKLLDNAQAKLAAIQAEQDGNQAPQVPGDGVEIN